MSFMAKDDDVLDKYNKIWDKIKSKLNIKFYSASVHDEKYIKAKTKEFDGVIKIIFLRNKIQKKKKTTLLLHSLRNYWFCYEKGKEKLSTSFFGRM